MLERVENQKLTERTELQDVRKSAAVPSVAELLQLRLGQAERDRSILGLAHPYYPVV